MEYLLEHNNIYRHTFLVGIIIIIVFFALAFLFRYFFFQNRIAGYTGSFDWVEMPSNDMRLEALSHKQKSIQHEKSINNTMHTYECVKGDYNVIAHQMQGYYGNIKGHNPVLYGLTKTDGTVVIEPQFKDMTCPTQEGIYYVQIFENNFYGTIRLLK